MKNKSCDLKGRLIAAVQKHQSKYTREWMENHKITLQNITTKRDVDVVISHNWLAVIDDYANQIDIGDSFKYRDGLYIHIIATGVTDEGVTMFPFVWKEGW